jgi:hypothetical protein
MKSSASPQPQSDTTPDHSSRIPVIRLEHLWITFALSIIAIFISMVPTTPHDFWWHLKIGEIIATQPGGIPTTNMFAWSLPADSPYVYQSWLGEWLLYAVYALGGHPLVIFARNLLGLVAFALVAFEARRRSGSWRLAAGVVLLAAAMSINNVTTRTQTWSWVPFALTLYICGAYTAGNLRPRWLALLPLIMAAWVNLHGAFVMGLLVVGAYTVGETIRRLLRQPHALPWQRIRMLAITLGATLIATFANPRGIGIYAYLQDLLSDTASQTFVNEWQSPTPRTLAGMFFYLSILVIIVGFALARQRPSITDLLLVCGLAWQAFLGMRYVIWFGMAAMPIVAQCFGKPRTILAATSTTPPTRRISGRERGGGTLPNIAVVVVLVLATVGFQPWFKPLLPLPQPYQELFAPIADAPLMYSSETPVAAAEHLRTTPCEGRIFNEMGYGSYLNWTLYPAQQVFVDPRVELYPLQVWQDYLSITKGIRAEALLQAYGVACVVLDTQLQPDLAAVLATSSAWQRTYDDRRSEVWRQVK